MRSRNKFIRHEFSAFKAFKIKGNLWFLRLIAVTWNSFFYPKSCHNNSFGKSSGKRARVGQSNDANWLENDDSHVAPRFDWKLGTLDIHVDSYWNRKRRTRRLHSLVPINGWVSIATVNQSDSFASNCTKKVRQGSKSVSFESQDFRSLIKHCKRSERKERNSKESCFISDPPLCLLKANEWSIDTHWERSRSTQTLSGFLWEINFSHLR